MLATEYWQFIQRLSNIPPPRLPRPEAGTAGGMVVANREPALEEPRSLKPNHHSDNSDRGINSAISFAAPSLHSERGVEGLSIRTTRYSATVLYIVLSSTIVLLYYI